MISKTEILLVVKTFSLAIIASIVANFLIGILPGYMVPIIYGASGFIAFLMVQTILMTGWKLHSGNLNSSKRG